VPDFRRRPHIPARFVTRLSPVFGVPGLPLRRLGFGSAKIVTHTLGIKPQGSAPYPLAGDAVMAHDGGALAAALRLKAK
jgi:hypothetical protein